MSAALLEVRGLRVQRGEQSFVRGIDLRVEEGACLGLAGESGCGKSLTALALMGLLPAGFTATADAAVFDSQSLDLKAGGKGLGMAIVFQDPATALDPVFRVGDQLAGALRRLNPPPPGGHAEAVHQALSLAGFDDPVRMARAWPHELSGGMRQRVMIAMAAAVRPRLLIADEPTTALDVTTQARIMALLDTLREDIGTAVLLVSHDLALIAQHARQAQVMYRGRTVETGDCQSLFQRPRHPYTAGLLAALPRLDAPPGELPRPIPGQVPPLGKAVTGCAFRDRCDRALDRCRQTTPVLDDGGAACFHPLESTEVTP